MIKNNLKKLNEKYQKKLRKNKYDTLFYSKIQLIVNAPADLRGRGGADAFYQGFDPLPTPACINPQIFSLYYFEISIFGADGP